MIGFGLNIGNRVVSTELDVDAQAFVTRVTTAGGTLSTKEISAVNQLVVELKAAGLWNKIHALYPMVGASAASCAQNIKGSTFTGTFSSGWTFSSTGVNGNGTGAYMDTGFNPLLNFNDFDNGASIYSRSDISDTSYDYGITKSGGVGHNVYLNYAGVGMRWHLQCTFAQRPQLVPSGNSSSGFFSGVTGASNDRRIYKNGTLLASDTQTSTTTLAQLNDSIVLGAQRNDGVVQNYSQRQYALFALHRNLNASEISSLNAINTRFQNVLAR